MRDRKSAKLIDIREIDSSRNSGLSVCMIARDESRFIGEALSSVKDLADEVIVVDTGSQDDTLSVASQFGARIHRVGWQQDFSEARNFALSRASCKWILVLDADEEIARQDVARIKELIGNGKEAAYTFEQRTYVNETCDLGCQVVDSCDPMSRGSAFFRDSQIRLFPNRASIRYACEIHENPDASIISLGIPIEDSGIAVHHYGRLLGYERVYRKALIWLAMGREASHPFPAHPYYLYEMAVQFLALRNLEAAQRHLDLALEIDSSSWLLWNAYGLLRVNQKDFGSALDCFRRAMRISGPNVQVLSNMGVSLMKKGEDAEALLCFESALKLDDADADLLRNAAAACARVGDIESGCGYITRSLEIEPFVASSHVIAAELLLRSGDEVGAIRALDRIRFLPVVPLDVRLKCIQMYLNMNRLDDADAAASCVLEGFPDMPDILHICGKIAESKVQDSIAETLYRITK